MLRELRGHCLALLIIAAPATGQERPDPAAAPRGADPAREILAAIDQEPLRLILDEVLRHNPEIARARARARAAAARAPQARALPDPMAEVQYDLSPPETRVGPQGVMLGLSQSLPWFGKLRLREAAAQAEAAGQEARVAAVRLAILTEARRLYHELAFLDALERVLREDRDTLAHYEELARSRYAAGRGPSQDVVKIQAEITRDDERLLDLATRRAELRAALNALRDREAGSRVPVAPLSASPALRLELADLRRRAQAGRPELAAARAEIEAARRRIELARKEYRPDVTVGVTFIEVGERTDREGRINPPEDNGQDILTVSGGINLPIWKKKLAAGVEEAVGLELAAQEELRAVAARIEGELGDLHQRLALTWDRLRLFQDVLQVQAAESLRSAEAGYASGTRDALDLLDAERVLLEVQIATERARADYAVALAQLEGAVAAPLAAASREEVAP